MQFGTWHQRQCHHLDDVFGRLDWLSDGHEIDVE
jgi:hypothetical protein